jgi:hypothetical protein
MAAPCAICLDPCDAAAGGTHALPCGHRFHAACVIDWFRSLGASHDQCPTCRDSPHGSERERAALLPAGGGGLFLRATGSVPRVVTQHIAFLDSERPGWTKAKRTLYDRRVKAVRAAALRAKRAKLDAAKHAKKHKAPLAKQKQLQRDLWRKRSKQMLAMRVLINSFQIDRFVVRELRPAPAPAPA